MSNKLEAVAKVAIFLAVVVFAVSITTSTGAFSTASLNRPTAIDLGSGESLIGVDTTDHVSVACDERLVTMTNNFDDSAQFTVILLEDRDGELTLDESTPSHDSVSFTLAPRESRIVYITGVRGPIWDDVEFDITATTADTEIVISKRVTKVPGNEDSDRDDGNWGGDGCDNEEEADDENDDDRGGPPPWADGPND